MNVALMLSRRHLLSKKAVPPRKQENSLVKTARRMVHGLVIRQVDIERPLFPKIV
jgi:hypothetical protein